MLWHIWHQNGSDEVFDGDVAEHLRKLYPEYPVEVYTDQVIVYPSVNDIGKEDVEIIASAIPE